MLVIFISWYDAVKIQCIPDSMVHIIPLGHHAGHTGLCACCPSRLHLVVAQWLVRGTSVQPVHSTYTSWSTPNTDGAHSGYPAVAHIFPAIRDGLYEAWIWWPSQNKPVNIFLMYLGPLSTKTAKKSDPIKKMILPGCFLVVRGQFRLKIDEIFNFTWFCTQETFFNHYFCFSRSLTSFSTHSVAKICSIIRILFFPDGFSVSGRVEYFIRILFSRA